jgi:hypothetical protein
MRHAGPVASVVIPCLDEERTLPACNAAALRGIDAAGIAGEVIVVDNGSTDRSVAVAEAAGARVVRCDRRGYGNALRAGFAAARGRFIIVSKAGAAGLRISEIPITLHRDARGRPPHLRSFRDGWRHLRYMLMMAPNWLFFLPGLLSLGMGALLIGALLPGPLRVGAVTLDVHTMLLGMALALLGVYLLLLGCFVKAFSFTERLGATSAAAFASALRRVKLEHGLVAGGALVAVGLAGDLWFPAARATEVAGPRSPEIEHPPAGAQADAGLYRGQPMAAIEVVDPLRHAAQGRPRPLGRS